MVHSVRAWRNAWVAAGQTVRSLTTRAMLKRFCDDVLSRRGVVSRVLYLYLYILPLLTNRDTI